MQRWLFNIAAILSLLIGIASVLFWLLPNHWYCVAYTTSANDQSRRSYAIGAWSSHLRLFELTGISGRRPGLLLDQYSYDRKYYWDLYDDSPTKWRAASFSYFARSSPGSSNTINDDNCVAVHLGWITFSSAVLPGLWIVRKRKQIAARRKGSCRFCFYDLTGNESGVCPECGTVLTSK